MSGRIVDHVQQEKRHQMNTVDGEVQYKGGDGFISSAKFDHRQEGFVGNDGPD